MGSRCRISSFVRIVAMAHGCTLAASQRPHTIWDQGMHALHAMAQQLLGLLVLGQCPSHDMPSGHVMAWLGWGSGPRYAFLRQRQGLRTPTMQELA